MGFVHTESGILLKISKMEASEKYRMVKLHHSPYS
jgi:hypothetical protein